MEVNTTYRDNLKTVMQVNKKYTDDKIEQALELLEDYDLSSETISQISQTATAPSDVRTSSLIEIGGNCVKLAPSTTSDSTVAKDKSIPNNTFKLNINQIGGMNYKTPNLFYGYNTSYLVRATDFNYSSDQEISFVSTGGDSYIGNVAENGISWNNFGTVYEVKENTTYAYAFFDSNIDKNYCTLLNSNKVSSGFARLSNTSGTFTTATGTKYVLFRFGVGEGVEGTTYHCKFMLVEGSTVPTEFKQGFEGIRDSAVTSVVTEGENLLNVPNVSQTTINGITYKIENGVVTLNGTATSSVTIPIDLVTPIPAGTYSFNSFNTKIVQFRSTSEYDAGTYIGNWQSFNAKTFTTQIYRLSLYFTNGTQVSNLVVKPMLVRGSTAPTEFKPYLSPITKTIPAGIQALAGYGWGINDTCYNYIDFENKKFVQKVGITVIPIDIFRANSDNSHFYLNPSDTITYFPNKQDVIYGTNQDNNHNAMCDKYPLGYFGTNNSFYISQDNYFRIFDNSIANISELQAKYPNGFIVYYELATPVETDISSYLTDFNPITLNNNYASVEFVNTHNQNIPNTISFFGTIKETLVNSFTIDGVTTSITDTIESDGWSTSSTVFNTRNIRDKERIKRVGRVDLGSLEWVANSASNSTYRMASTGISTLVNKISSSTTPNVLCEKYNAKTANETYSQQEGVSIGNDGAIYIYDSNYNTSTSVSSFKTAMSGVYLYYELANPETTTLNVTKDFHYIDLASGETITFNNTNNQPCHNTIRYSIMEEKL